MNLPAPDKLNEYVQALFGKEYTDTLRSLAKPVNPLADATPAPWATPSHEGAEL